MILKSSTFSKDGHTIYFVGICDDTEKIKVSELNCYSTSIFSYDKETGEIKEVYTPDTDGRIADLNIKY